MSESPEYPFLDVFERYLNTYFIFPVSLLLSLLFLIRFKFKRLDKAACIITLAYLISFTGRVFIEGEGHQYRDIILPVGSIIIYASLIYFTFEMGYIHAKLIS